jgi:Ca2+-binding RTX toxin-like protein
MDRKQRSESLAMTHRCRRFTMAALATLLGSVFMAGMLGRVPSLEAGLQQGDNTSQVLVGADDDNGGSPIIHRPGIEPDQSLQNTDILLGGFGNDVLIGRLGNDVLQGGFGRDILIGGPEGGNPPNNDVLFGGFSNDISIWAPGDGNDAFIGGPGFDAQVFGVTDLDANGLPVLTPEEGFPQGIPSANVTGMDGRCELDLVADPAFGYQWLVRFFVRSSGESTATVRLAEVEQVFCPGPEAGQIVFADLTTPTPAFVVVTLDQVQQVNSLVRAIIR